MAYTRTTWVNGSTPAINVTNLNKIEQGLVDAHSPSVQLANIKTVDRPGSGLDADTLDVPHPRESHRGVATGDLALSTTTNDVPGCQITVSQRLITAVIDFWVDPTVTGDGGTSTTLIGTCWKYGERNTADGRGPLRRWHESTWHRLLPLYRDQCAGQYGFKLRAYKNAATGGDSKAMAGHTKITAVWVNPS
jgi:hypothetical protein